MSSSLFEEGNDKIFDIGRICQLNETEIMHNDLPHLHDFYSIFWIESGEAIHATEFVEYSLGAGTILFVPPGLKHRMYIDKSVTGTYILFNEEFIRYNNKNQMPLKDYRLFNHPDFKSLITVTPQKHNQLQNIIEQIYAEIQNRDDYSQDIVLNLLHLFLLESRRIFDLQYQEPKAVPEETPDNTIIRFKQLIEENYITQKSVSPYAEMLNINASCLNELTKRTLLFSGSSSGKEIAFQLGFDDPAYFSRFFKKYTGTTLKEFRDISRKKYH